MKASKLLANFGPITTEQYFRCRDAGFSEQELNSKNQLWFDQNISIIKWSDPKQPAFEKQIALLLKYDVEIDVELNYSMARYLMRELAVMDGTDTIYLEQIAIFKKQNDHRNEVKRQKRAEAKDKVVPISKNQSNSPLAGLEIVGSDESDTKEFFKSLKKHKVS